MNFSKNIQPISYIKTNTASALKQVTETREPMIITQHGKAKGVFMDIKSYEEMQKALGIMKLIAQSEEEFRKGNYQSQEEVFSNLEKRFKRTDNEN